MPTGSNARGFPLCILAVLGLFEACARAWAPPHRGGSTAVRPHGPGASGHRPRRRANCIAMQLKNTNHLRKVDAMRAAWADTLLPAVVLVRPDREDHVGMTARSIFNFGHGRLRLVDARCEHCTGNAVGYASGAGEVLQEAGVFSSLALAVEDVAHVFAIVSAESALGPEGRAMEPISLGATAAEAISLSAEAGALSCAVVFGASENDLRSLPTEPRRVLVGTHDGSLELPQCVSSLAPLRYGLAALTKDACHRLCVHLWSNVPS